MGMNFFAACRRSLDGGMLWGDSGASRFPVDDCEEFSERPVEENTDCCEGPPPVSFTKLGDEISLLDDDLVLHICHVIDIAENPLDEDVEDLAS